MGANLLCGGILQLQKLRFGKLVAVAIYRLTLHPLARYPGPLLWKLSVWPTVFLCRSGKRHLQIFAAHKKYGSVVRIGPNMLSFDSSSSVSAIYGPRHGNMVKSDFHLTLDATISTPSLFAIVDKEKHAFRRRVIMQAFTENAMLDASEFYIEHTKVLVKELQRKVQDGWAKANIGEYAVWWTLDVMGALSLGKTFNCLTESTYRHGIPMMRNGIRYTYWAGHLPFRKAIDYMLASPILSRFGGQSALDNQNYFDFCELAIQERIQDETDAIAAGVKIEERRKDYIHHLLKAVDPETGNQLSYNELKSDASLLLAAGSDTMSNTIAAFMFYMARHQRCRDLVTTEIREKFADPAEIRYGPVLSSCTYLDACINEVMRIAVPAAVSPSERVTTGEGIVVDGNYFPAGITMGTSFYALNLNEAVHRDAFKFWPERWLVDETGKAGTSKEEVQKTNQAFFPFSAGHRRC
ncbi:uncharacterized protein N7482_001583, partial [Penicillium canariense]